MVAIVAIPAMDDPVWRFSSEKVPHLTLLFLGDRIDNAGRVTDYIRHASNTVLRRFYLDVTRRGTLGDQSADVLFFNTEHAQTVIDFRRYLLAQEDIFAAYNRVDQFPTWKPHLTMGFPETPAKPDNRDYPGIHSVRFDRIALWTGDYEGVEIPLTTEEVALSMADAGKAFLEHYGVKGMKWGVLRDKASKGHAAYRNLTTSKDAQEAKKVRVRAKVTGVESLTNKDLQTAITRMNLEQQYSTLKKVEHEQSLVGAGKKWAGNFVTNVLRDAAASWLSNPFSARRRRARGGDAFRTQAWTTGQNVGRVIDGGVVNSAAIGR